MPHVWDNILVCTKDELIGDGLFPSYPALKMSLRRHKDKSYGPKRAQHGGNCRKLRVVFDSLPKKYQQIIGDPRKSDHILEQYYKVSAEATRFYTEFQFEDGEYLTLDAQDKHITNATVLEAVTQLEIARRTERLNKGGTVRDIPKTLFADAMSFIELKEDKNPNTFQCSLPRSYRRFMERAYNPYKKGKRKSQADAFQSIIKKYKSNNNARKVTGNVEKLFNDMFSEREHKPSKYEVAKEYEAFISGYLEVINGATGEVYSPKGFPKLSDRTITSYLSKWENSIGNEAARSGDRQKLLTKFSPYHSFERPQFAGSLLSIDDRNPPFEYEKGKRMWFYLGIDLASAAYTVMVWGKTKEGIILEFYRQMVRNYHQWGFNLPDGLECESSLNSSFKDSFLREGVMFQDVRIESNKARSKRIERYFRDMRYGSEKQAKGWIARPWANDESNQSSSQAKEYIPYEELVNDRLQDLQDWNNTAEKDRDISRWDYFCEMQHKNLKPTNYKAIIPQLGFKTETSCNVGIIRLQRREFILGDHDTIYTGDKLINLMKKVEGRNIDVYWLDDNQGGILKAYVFIGNQLICQALPKPKPNRARIERTPEQEKEFALFAAYAKTIDQYQLERKNELEPITTVRQKPKTLNNNFQIPQLNLKGSKTRDNQEPAEVLDDIEDDYTYVPQENTAGGWRDSFNN